MAAQSPNSSFSSVPGVEEELQDLRRRLSEEEASSRTLQERLQTSEQLLREKDQAHAEQVPLMLVPRPPLSSDGGCGYSFISILVVAASSS